MFRFGTTHDLQINNQRINKAKLTFELLILDRQTINISRYNIPLIQKNYLYQYKKMSRIED